MSKKPGLTPGMEKALSDVNDRLNDLSAAMHVIKVVLEERCDSMDSELALGLAFIVERIGQEALDLSEIVDTTGDGKSPLSG